MEMQPGKGDAQVAQYSPVQTVPTASDSRLRHLALLCDHADIAPRSIFFLLPLPLSIDLLPGIWNEPWCFPLLPPFVRPGRWVLRDRLVWFSIPPFLLLRHVVTPLSPRLSPPRAPPLGDDRYLFPSHELAFLVPDRGDVSEAGWARLIKPPLDLTTVHFPPVNAPVS